MRACPCGPFSHLHVLFPDASLLRAGSPRSSNALPSGRRRPRAAAPEVGLTLDDLERIAAETGLDAAHLRAAAAEVDAAGGAVERRSRSTSHLFVERWLPGGLTDDAWDDLVSDLQNRFGKSGAAAFLPVNGVAGRVEQVGRNREWVHTDGLGVETRVMASDRGDRTRLRLSQRVGLGNEVTDGSVVGLSFGVLAGLVTSAILGLDGVWIAAMIALMAVAIGVATYAFDVRWRRRKHDDLDALAGHLADVSLAAFAARTDSAAPASLPTAARPALDLDALPEAPATTGPLPGDRLRA